MHYINSYCLIATFFTTLKTPSAQNTVPDAESHPGTRESAEGSTSEDEPSSRPRELNGGGAEEEGASLFQAFSTWLRDSVSRKNGDASFREAIEEVMEEHEDSEVILSPQGKTIFTNVLALGDLRVDDAMIPRADIVAVPIDVSLQNLKQVILEEEHTRMPVYKENLDNVLGFVHIKDLIPYLGTDKPFSLDDVIRQLLIVPPSMKVLDLLVKMRLAGVHMAIVVDEYGGTDGLLTLEDLVEQIVGDIHDEHDEDNGEKELLWTGSRTLEVLARADVDDLEEALGRELNLSDREEDFDTVGGLIFTMLARVPDEGEVIEHPNGVTFKILEADRRRIHKVQVNIPLENPSRE